MSGTKNILVAPLNWGIGHACRCVPIIDIILNLGHHPIIASDGASLQYLKKEFPLLKHVELPAYDVEYPENRMHFKTKILAETPKILSAIAREHKLLKKLITEHHLDLVLADNRLGLYSKKVRTVFITHQKNVLSGTTTWLSTRLHNHYINKFDQCWIPDYADNMLAGKLSRVKNGTTHHKYIGPLSRFAKMTRTEFKYDLMILLSGPEPQRSILERKLLEELKGYTGKTLFISGLVEDEQKVHKNGKLTHYNFLTQEGLQKAFNLSKLVLCRSGYSTIMDLYQMKKKAFFIPTPGQYEQEYLAKHFKKAGIAPFSSQEDFSIDFLNQTESFTGFVQDQSSSTVTSISSILEELFSSVKENSEPIPSSLST